MTKDEALKLALAALEGADEINCDMRDAITAIKEALAQPEQEPVAWLTRNFIDGLWYATNTKKSEDDKPLYTSPPQRQQLTDAEILDLAMQSGAFDEQLLAFARAIEAKLKELNA